VQDRLTHSPAPAGSAVDFGIAVERSGIIAIEPGQHFSFDSKLKKA